MSCFKGRMSEYRNISLDRFDGPNLNSTVYFLSHLHEDHTVGLSVSSFITRLKESSEVYLYCSDVTKVLLIESPKYQHLERYIKTLPVNQTVTVSIPQAASCKIDFVQVTLLPAAHCPGSVMFLFEGSEGTALYTGDFRWEANHISKVTALHNGDSVKPIQSLYVDTTFCHPDCFHIPSRQDCVEAVSGLVKEWIAKGQGHVVHFTPRSQYGHEHLLKEISTRTKLKIHVSKAKVKIYEQISDLRGIFTSDPDETPIHACLGERFAKSDCNSLPCGYQPPNHSKFNKMVILPSTMYFTKKMRLNLTHIVERTRGIYRVCYSFHSSYSEVRSLVTYLKPGKVRPNVKPEPDPCLGEVQKRLNHFLKLEHIEQNYETVSKTFGTLKKRKIKKRKYTRLCSSDSDDLVFGSPDLKRIRSQKGNITPVKNQGVAGPAGDREGVAPSSPQEAVTPMKSDKSDAHSSYAGSDHDDSEMSETGLLCDSSDDQKEISGFQEDDLSTPPQSLLDAIDSQCASQEVNSFRVTFLEDEEQTVGQQAWESPDIPDFGEEGTNSDTEIREESMLTDRDNEDKSNVVDTDNVGDISSQKMDMSVTNGTGDEIIADTGESLHGYQGDVDSEMTDASQACLEEDLDTGGNVYHSKETTSVAKEAKQRQNKAVSPVSKSDDELLEEDSNKLTDIRETDSFISVTDANLDSGAEHNGKDKSTSECNRKERVNTSQNCPETSKAVSLTVKQQSTGTKSSHSQEWKKNGSYDLFEGSNDGFSAVEIEGGECQISSASSVHGTSEKDRKVDSDSEKLENFDSKSSEMKPLKDGQENNIKTDVQVCVDSQIVTEKKNLSQEMSQKSEGFEVTDLTQNYDEQSCISNKEKQDVQLVPTSHVCQTTNEKVVSDKKLPNVSKSGVHRLSSCDTPGTSRSVCQCVLDASPQPETILVEIQEENEREQGTKQNRQQNKRSPQKPSSKLLTNTQTNDLVIAILDSDSESDEQVPRVHKVTATSVHGYESDSDITLPPSQEVNKVTRKVREVCSSPGGKDEDVMIIDDYDSEDESEDSSSSTSSSSSDGSLRNIRLNKIQRALYIRNNEKMTGDITRYLGSNTADIDNLSDDSDCAVIDLTQSDSDEDSRAGETSHPMSHPKDES